MTRGNELTDFAKNWWRGPK